MAPIRISTGRIVDLHRYLTRAPRLTDHDPCRERWELWIATPTGHEHKFIVYSRTMPARVGHSAQVLHMGSTAVGLYNLTTGDRVNFARADPALLVRRIDGAVLLGCLATRFQKSTLEWDAAKMQITNNKDANTHVRRTYRKGWEVNGL